MASHQAPPSLGFPRQEHWSGLPVPSPMHESEKWKWSRSVVSDPRDPMDCSLPGSYVHGIFQARVLEWGAIAFSDRYTYSFINSLIVIPSRPMNINSLRTKSWALTSVVQALTRSLTSELQGLTKSFIHTHLRYTLVQTLHLSIHEYLCLLIL